MTFANFLYLVVGIGIGYYLAPILLEWAKDLINFLKGN
jgi:hypothetical protein